MAKNYSTRADDEKLLRMLRLRKTHDCESIGRMFGMRQESVRVATNYVVTDDSKAEGRDTRDEFGFLSRAAATRIGLRRAA